MDLRQFCWNMYAPQEDVLFNMRSSGHHLHGYRRFFKSSGLNLNINIPSICGTTSTGTEHAQTFPPAASPEKPERDDARLLQNVPCKHSTLCRQGCRFDPCFVPILRSTVSHGSHVFSQRTACSSMLLSSRILQHTSTWEGFQNRTVLIMRTSSATYLACTI